MIRPIWTALVLALLLSAPARAQDAAGTTPVVGGILVEGNRRVEIDAVKAAVSSKAGQPLDAARLDEDIKSVMRLGFFSDVVIEERGDPARPTLVFRVVERPAVRQVRVEGNEEISNDDLKETIAEVKPFSIVDLKAVTAATKKIQEKYVEKGFFLAEVKYQLVEEPENQVDVVFQVAEHAKVQVREITFIGNDHVPREDITPYMQTREGGWLSFLTSAGTYREEAFQRDLGAVQFVYGDRGYLYAKVEQPAISLSPDRRFMTITLRIEEGQQYRVGNVSFEGELLDREPILHRISKVEPGELFARSKVGKDLTAVGDVYKDLGYAYANVTPLTQVHEEEKTVDISYDVQPGQKVYFERIEVAGNSRTRDKVIRRELRIYEGALYSQTAINVSKQRVTALGYFETVEVKTERGSADDKIVARVEVKEKSTGTFQIGAGFSSYENFILTGQISQNNFFGWGQSLSLQVQWSSIRQLGNIQFIEPYFLDTRWTFAFDLYATEATYTTFNRTAFGGSMTWGYELVGLAPWWNFARHLEDMRLFATYTNERVNVSRNFEDILLANRFRSGTTSAVRLSLQWDKRDNRLFPSAGFFHTISAEFAPPLLAPESVFGNSVNLFSRYTFDARFYRPIIWGFIGRLKLSTGYIREWDSAHPIPISELYYLGGINSVRGYRMLSIAPRVTAAVEPRGDAATGLISVGGDKQLTLNMEIEFPIMDKVGIRGVVFHDLGNAFRPGKYTDPEVPLSLYRSVGFGLRWFSPIGPLRFEWGFPLNRRKNP
ncbi:MAG TPA: outer membrane protein assembly factor BamA, partial [Anaeromyxobacteraceae bacterium]|nr:outer membrane protein assembly factor BamA [Anaeromyxobacteraceae bacterium]